MIDFKIFLENAEDYKVFQEKANQFELEGNFNSHLNEEIPEGSLPIDETFPFIRKGLKYNINHFICLQAMKIYVKRIAKFLKFEVKGKENLKLVKNKPTIITCNHISKFDSFAIRHAVTNDYMYVATEDNNWPGKLGHLARHTGFLPLSNKLSLLRKFNEAMEYYLEKKHKKILIYPEQAMWRDYKKPRPLKNGAFHYAAKHNAAVLPVFITFRNSGVFENGVEILYYTINILKPILPKSELNKQENINYLRTENYNEWKDCYEKTYSIPLEYTTIDKSKIKI